MDNVHSRVQCTWYILNHKHITDKHIHAEHYLCTQKQDDPILMELRPAYNHFSQILFLAVRNTFRAYQNCVYAEFCNFSNAILFVYPSKLLKQKFFKALSECNSSCMASVMQRQERHSLLSIWVSSWPAINNQLDFPQVITFACDLEITYSKLAVQGLMTTYQSEIRQSLKN